MREPSERLGAGPPGSNNDIQALRSHPFFTSTTWETLWTAPPPPIEPGLVKREHPLATGTDQDWDDVGAAWDDLVGNDVSDNDDDDVEWASDGDAPAYEVRRHTNTNGFNSTLSPKNDTFDIGPMGEIRRPILVNRETESTGRTAVPIPQTSNGIAEHSSRLDSPLTGSPTSSSESGPVDNLTVRMETMGLPVPERSSNDTPHPPGEERGRTQVTSPVQGHGSSDDVD